MKIINAPVTPNHAVSAMLESRRGYNTLDTQWLKRVDRRRQRHTLRTKLVNQDWLTKDDDNLEPRLPETTIDTWASRLGKTIPVVAFPARVIDLSLSRVVPVIRKRGHRRVVEQLRIAA